MSLMICRTRTALELSRIRRSADDRYYYETPEFDSVHAECKAFIGLTNRAEVIGGGGPFYLKF